MIHLLLYHPILLIRKIVLYIFVLVVILSLAIYTIANSSSVITKLANAYAPDYNISFSRIHGNVVTGVEVDNLSYNNQKLADSINFRWNPSGLMRQRVIIDSIKVTNIDIKAIEIFVASFDSNSSEDNLTVEEEDINSTNPYIPTIVELQELSIDIAPIEYEPVYISYLKLKGANAIFDIETLTLKSAKLDLNASTNLTDILYTTKVKDNHLIGRLGLKPQKELFDKYELPLNRASIGDINLDLNVSSQKIEAYLNKNIKELLLAKKDEFNLDIDNIYISAIYDINQSTLVANTNARVTTPYAKDIKVSNIFSMDKNISYTGEIYIKEILGVEKKYIDIANNLNISYSGDTKSVDTNLSSNNLQGSVTLPDFTKAVVHLHTKNPLALNQFVSLPKELNQTKANVVIDASKDNPIYFDTNKTIKLKAIVSSDMLNIDSDIIYKDRLSVSSNIQIPQNSNLREFQKDVKWDNLSPISTEVNLVDRDIALSLHSPSLRASAYYNNDSTKLSSNIILDRLNLDIRGYTSDNLKINTNIKSIPLVLKSINRVYKLDNIPLKGGADISVNIEKLKNINMSIKSPKIEYQADRKTAHIVEDIAFDISMRESNIVLEKYNLLYKKQKIFSTKPSNISIENENIKIAPFWINDEVEILGGYNIKLKRGDIDTLSNSLKISHELADVEAKLDIKTSLDGNDTTITGDVTILNGKLKYDLDTKSFASDSDIIILQDVKDSKPSPFMDNLTTNIKVKTQRALSYKKAGINIDADVDLTIYKTKGSPLMVLGSIELLREGSYTFEDKRFILNKSHLYFTGNPSKPTLAISIKYKSLNHTITIRITGQADNPDVKFSSSPALSEEQILSVILFDSEIGAENNSGSEMMRMMGGAVAKSALSNLGIKIDHLILGEGNSIEIGKKISNKITIIYVNDIISSVKVKYEHNRNTDSTLQMSPESQSYDIVFKKRF